MDKFRILVCGSREIPLLSSKELYATLERELMTRLDKLYSNGWGAKQVVLLHGGAAGVDSMIGEIASFYGIHTEIWKPAFVNEGFIRGLGTSPERAREVMELWNRKAPLERNRAMIASKPNVVLAFTGAEVTGGTGHTMTIAGDAGIPVTHVRITPQKEKVASDPFAAENTGGEGFVANDEEVAADTQQPLKGKENQS